MSEGKIQKVEKVQYQCLTCKAIYDKEQPALDCAERPVQYNRGITPGDIVLITRGDGEGHTATVTKVSIMDKHWGHYQWEKYWHTVALNADVNHRNFASRLLVFDSYTTIEG